MTDQRSDTSSEAVIDEALGVIDNALAKMMQRELVSSGEVADLLLDVRTLLTTDSADAPSDDAAIDPIIDEVSPVASEPA